MKIVIIEPENISRMMVSFSVSGSAIKRQTGSDCSIFQHRPTAAFREPVLWCTPIGAVWSRRRPAFGARASPAGAWQRRERADGLYAESVVIDFTEETVLTT
jgi:hypothetical protein